MFLFSPQTSSHGHEQNHINNIFFSKTFVLLATNEMIFIKWNAANICWPPRLLGRQKRVTLKTSWRITNYLLWRNIYMNIYLYLINRNLHLKNLYLANLYLTNLTINKICSNMQIFSKKYVKAFNLWMLSCKKAAPIKLKTQKYLRIWSHLLKKSLMENFIFCAVNKQLQNTLQQLKSSIKG